MNSSLEITPFRSGVFALMNIWQPKQTVPIRIRYNEAKREDFMIAEGEGNFTVGNSLENSFSLVPSMLSMYSYEYENE